MLGFLSRSKAKVETPLSLNLSKSDFELQQDYLTACSKLGYDPEELRDLIFKKFLFDNEIPLYDYEQVVKYLQYLVDTNPIYSDGPGRYHIVWRGLRLSDGCSYVTYKDAITADIIIRHSDEDGHRPYNRIVPLRVLKTIALIQGAYPSSKFYVSDLVKIPDPFAAVNIGTKTFHVFAVWDEPGFSG
jgi:hypothetical protein